MTGAARIASSPTPSQRAGVTLIELVLATALLSIVMVAVFSLLDGSLSLWRRTETGRSMTEQATGVMELLAHDLRSLEPGSSGDVLAEWVQFDTDGDGVPDRSLPRLRMVRQASAAEVARITAGWEKEPPIGASLLEVSWIVLPAKGDADVRQEGIVWRGERLTSESERVSFFDPSYFDARGKPRAGEFLEVTGGVLWFGPLFATQTSIVYDGWRIGDELSDAATSWDAWNLARPDASQSGWNEAGAGMPKVEGRPALPRRVRVELEFERPTDRLRRTRTTDHAQSADVALVVEDGSRLPTHDDAYVLVAGEWMQVKSVAGNRLIVKRAQRGTAPRPIPAGTMVHWGTRAVREVPVRLYREDWNL